MRSAKIVVVSATVTAVCLLIAYKARQAYLSRMNLPIYRATIGGRPVAVYDNPEDPYSPRTTGPNSVRSIME